MFYGLNSLFIAYEYLDMDLTKIIHNNKDLTPFKEISISEYFKNKNKIHLKMNLLNTNLLLFLLLFLDW